MTLTLYSYAGPGASYAGEVVVADPYAPAPESVTTVPPPAFAPPQIPAWRSGAWVILDAVPVLPPPSPPPPPPPEVRRVDKVEFQRLFTTPETVAFNLARRQVQSLTVADYTSTDPAKQALVGLEVFLLRYDAISVIELTHPETIEGMSLLVALGVVTQARADDILAGKGA